MAGIQSQHHRCPHTACLSAFPPPPSPPVRATSQCRPLWHAHLLTPATCEFTLTASSALPTNPVKAPVLLMFWLCISQEGWTLNICYLHNIWIVCVIFIINLLYTWVHGVLFGFDSMACRFIPLLLFYANVNSVRGWIENYPSPFVCFYLDIRDHVLCSLFCTFFFT